MSRAFIFPGQGSQGIGMGKYLYDQYPSAKALFDKADEVLGYSLKQLCFEGPDDQLKLTQHAQPALYTTSLATYEVLKDKGYPAPDYVAGHSLGEYSALSAAGVFDFETGLKLVFQRGQLMAEAAKSVPGAMAAVLGMTAEEVKSLCESVSKESGIVVVANYNCPGQIVISGEVPAVQAAVAALKAMKKKAIPLAVSGGFHSPLLKEANEKFSAILDTIEFKDSRFPVVSNTTAKASTSGSELKEALKAQMVSSVYWEDSLNTMQQAGVTELVEVGSGAVLTGLVKKTLKEAATYSTGDNTALETLFSTIS